MDADFGSSALVSPPARCVKLSRTQPLGYSRYPQARDLGVLDLVEAAHCHGADKSFSMPDRDTAVPAREPDVTVDHLPAVFLKVAS